MKVEIKINQERCKGCGICIAFCPKKILKLSKKTNKNGLPFAEIINKENCRGCANCAIVCPDVCIEIKKGDKDEA